jgi:predicted dienelactone hydrolase
VRVYESSSLGTAALCLGLIVALSAIAVAAEPAASKGAIAPKQAAAINDAGPAVGFDELRIPNGNEPPLIAGVWYPTKAEPHEQLLEGLTQRVALHGSVSGQNLPMVVLSHGGGGSYLGHYDTALALARAGFIVAAVSHAGDTFDDQSKVLMLWRRPAQLSQLIDYMLGEWRGRAAIDPRRVGAFGFSNGGFTVLVEAGAVPDLSKIDGYCASNPGHDLCTALTSAGVRSVAPIAPPADVWKPDHRIRAVAAAAPAFGFTFDRAGLASVRIPVLLWRAANDRHQPSPWYEDWIRARLPRAPDYEVEPLAGHYAFLPPCSEPLKKAKPDICADAAGFDRADFHRRLNAELIRFFRSSLNR